MAGFSNRLFIFKNASLVVLIRPGMTAADLTALQTQTLEPDPRLPPEISKRLNGASYPWSITWLDDVVDSVIFHEGFPEDFPIDRLQIGMDKAAVLGLYSQAMLQPFRPGSDASLQTYILRTEPDGGRLKAIFAHESLMRLIFDSHLAVTRERENDAMKLRIAKAEEARIEERRKTYVPSQIWGRIDHPDAMLRAWAAGNDDDRTLAAWLLDASLIERHYFVTTWNWDRGETPMAWAVLRPDTLFVTALYLFWALGPDFYEKFIGREYALSDWQESHHELLCLVKRRIEAGLYTRPGSDAKAPHIAFKPPPIVPYLDRTAPTILALYPAEAFEILAGKEIDDLIGKWTCPVDYS